MVVIIVAFGHTMWVIYIYTYIVYNFHFHFQIATILTSYFYRYILLRDPALIGYTPNLNTYTLYNTSTNEKFSGLSVVTDYDQNSTSDNPFSDFLTAVDAVYFWINGSWVQRDSWDTWSIKILSTIASILLVSIMQNMFVAFMRYVMYN